MRVKQTTGRTAARSVLVALMASVAGTATAGTFDLGIPGGWTCTGHCGTSAADGVVTLAPAGGARYAYVSTSQGLPNVYLPIVPGSTSSGSKLQSPLFSAAAGEALAFYFNYVTSDGAGFADYAWARLLDSAGNEAALLFTARTSPAGHALPGFDLPVPAASLTPLPVPIIHGAPLWSPLGSDSGACYELGCGYTGWVLARYTIAAAGNYRVEFGSANFVDPGFHSGLAFDSVTVGGTAIEGRRGAGPAVPEPGTAALLCLGLAAAARRRRPPPLGAAHPVGRAPAPPSKLCATGSRSNVFVCSRH